MAKEAATAQVSGRLVTLPSSIVVNALARYPNLRIEVTRPDASGFTLVDIHTQHKIDDQCHFIGKGRSGVYAIRRLRGVPYLVHIVDPQIFTGTTTALYHGAMLLDRFLEHLLVNVETGRNDQQYLEVAIQQEIQVAHQSGLGMEDVISLQDVVSAKEIDDGFVLVTRRPQVPGDGKVPDGPAILRHHMNIPAGRNPAQVVRPTV